MHWVGNGENVFLGGLEIQFAEIKVLLWCEDFILSVVQYIHPLWMEDIFLQKPRNLER